MQEILSKLGYKEALLVYTLPKIHYEIAKAMEKAKFGN